MTKMLFLFDPAEHAENEKIAFDAGVGNYSTFNGQIVTQVIPANVKGFEDLIGKSVVIGEGEIHELVSKPYWFDPKNANIDFSFVVARPIANHTGFGGVQEQIISVVPGYFFKDPVKGNEFLNENEAIEGAATLGKGSYFIMKLLKVN